MNLLSRFIKPKEKLVVLPKFKVATASAVSIVLMMPFLVYVNMTVGNSTLTKGVGDVTSAMRYENSPGVVVSSEDASDVDNIIGSPLKDMPDRSNMDSDDQSTKFDVTWPMNFFGTKYPTLCVTTNGTVSPLLSVDSNCTNDYDNTLENFARDIKAPFIAAFANDGHPGRPVLPSLAAKIVTAELLPAAENASTRVLSVVTDVDHGIADGASRCLFFHHPTLDTGANTERFSPKEFVYCGVFTVGQNLRAFTVSVPITGYSFRNDSSSAMNLTNTPSTPFEISSGSSYLWDPTAANLAANQDGWGLPTTIYFGEAIIDGRPAYVITWYRIGQYDTTGPDIFSNTYQIILIQKPDTPNGSTNGFDFDIEYNYGTVQDGSDGYSSPELSCSGMGSGCRTGVGISNFIESSGTLDVYELFASTPSRDLVDWAGPQALTNNSLNSLIKGRYTFTFTGGVPTTFAIPVMTGAGEVLERPRPPSLLDPIPSAAQTDPGGLAYLINGNPATGLVVAQNESTTGLVITGPGDDPFTMNMAAASTDGGAPQNLDANGNLLLTAGKFVSISGEGFKANSEVQVFLFSDPVSLGSVTTNGNGQFTGSLPVPGNILPGVHTIQANGFRPNGSVRSVSLGVAVTSASIISSGPVYNGPIVLSISPGRAPTAGGSSIYLNGIRLDRTTSVRIGELELEVLSSRPNELIFKSPALAAGKYKIRVISDDGEFVFDALIISDQEALSFAESTRMVIGFASFSDELTPSMKREIRDILAKFPTATRISCKGYTSGPIVLPKDQILSNQRGSVACEYIETLRPDVETVVRQGKPDSRIGGQYRKVRIRVLELSPTS